MLFQSYDRRLFLVDELIVSLEENTARNTESEFRARLHSEFQPGKPGPTVCQYILLTKREVKMAGYWPSSLFAFLWTETKSRSIKT